MNSHEVIAQLLSTANTLARQEIVTALTAPHRNLVTLLHNRSEHLAKIEADEAAFNAMIDQLANITEKWGMF